MSNSKRNSFKNPKTIILYGIVLISLIAIGYYSLNPKDSINDGNTTQQTDNQTGNTDSQDIKQDNPDKKSDNEIKPEASADNSGSQKLQSNPLQKSSIQKDKDTIAAKGQDKVANTPVKSIPSAGNPNAAITIFKKDVTAVAKFYPYKTGDTNMEVIAVKATDGTIRTALNTCQVCFDSGRGYYVQTGDYLICQNCRNRFHINQVEIVKGGCNPVPILDKDKTDTGDSITISKDFLETQKELFSNWKKQ